MPVRSLVAGPGAASVSILRSRLPNRHPDQLQQSRQAGMEAVCQESHISPCASETLSVASCPLPSEADAPCVQRLTEPTPFQQRSFIQVRMFPGRSGARPPHDGADHTRVKQVLFQTSRAPAPDDGADHSRKKLPIVFEDEPPMDTNEHE